MTKAELRKIYLARKKDLPADIRIDNSKRIAARLFERFDLTQVNYLHCFISIERFNEIDTKPIFEKLWQDFPKIQTVVPRVDAETNEITNLKFGRDTQLSRNSWGIEEPSHHEYVDADRIDIVLVPGLCFDRQGHRVGYGKGFYDRFLKRCRPDCVTIGLSYFEPIEKIDDVHEGDVAVAFVVTPEAVRTGSGRDRSPLSPQKIGTLK